MKKHIYCRLCLLISAVLLLAVTFSTRAHAEADALIDSGIDYSDGIETVVVNGKEEDALFTNPYRGFHNWPVDLKLSKNSEKNKPVDPGKTAASFERSLAYLPVELSDFSGAHHLLSDGGRGEDTELTESVLDTLDKTLQNFKKSNNQVIIRFVYDKGNNGIESNEGWVDRTDPSKPKRYVEPEQEMVLRHIEQLAVVLNKNADVIYTVQIGFYGAYGELHSTGACTKSNINEALTKMLECTRESGIRISIRTPSRYAYYRDIDIGDIDNDVSLETEDAYRIAIFNDGYLGTDSDWGTFYNRDKETAWMAKQNTHNPYGGDAIPDPDGNVAFPAKQPFVLKEMEMVHTSYISATWGGALHQYWKDTKYDSSLYDKPDTEYEETTLYQYIENHLGYRFVLRSSKLSGTVKSGGKLSSTFEIENTGFGNLFYPVKSYAYITDKSGKAVAGPVNINIDPCEYKTKTTTSKSIKIDIPGDIASGDYNLYIQFKIGDRKVDGITKPYGSIRFANSGVWDVDLEANYVGTFHVDRDVTIIKKWESEEDADLRPKSISLTLKETSRLPDEYQEVEYIKATGTQYIDTGVSVSAAHTIYSDGYTYGTSSNHLLVAFKDNNNRLGLHLLGGSGRIQYYWRISNLGQAITTLGLESLDGIDVRKRVQLTQSSSGIKLKQGECEKTITYAGSVSGTMGTTWKIFYYNDDSTYIPAGVLYEARIQNQGEILHLYVPCYRKADGEIGVYDVVKEEFFSNSGEGTFEKGEDVEKKTSTINLGKDAWTANENTWETTISLKGFMDEVSIYENDVWHYEGDVTEDNKKIIDDSNKVTVTNVFKEHEWTGETVTRNPSCIENGEKVLTCKYNHTKTEIINATGHAWTDVTYEWTKDNDKWKCTASRTCQNDKTHKQTETVTAAPSVKRQPEIGATGERIYTATFADSDFEEQVKTEIIPELPAQETVSYSVTEGNNGSWEKGSTSSLGFVFKRSAEDDTTFSRFKGIRIDEKDVSDISGSEDNYKTRSGSVVVELQPKYLETLLVGNHTLEAVFDDGSAIATFTVSKRQESSDNTTDNEHSGESSDQMGTDDNDSLPDNESVSPKTGENSTLLLWVLMTLASVVLSVFCYRKSK